VSTYRLRLENQKWRGKRSEHGSSKAAAGAIKKAKRDEYVEKTQAARSLLKADLPHSAARCEYVLAGKCSIWAAGARKTTRSSATPVPSPR
jgi:hypothetical protein